MVAAPSPPSSPPSEGLAVGELSGLLGEEGGASDGTTSGGGLVSDIVSSWRELRRFRSDDETVSGYFGGGTRPGTWKQGKARGRKRLAGRVVS